MRKRPLKRYLARQGLKQALLPLFHRCAALAEVFSFNKFTLLLTEAPILDYIVARAAREKLRLHRERFHRRRIRA